MKKEKIKRVLAMLLGLIMCYMPLESPAFEISSITSPCGLTAEEIDERLKGGLKGYGETFLQAERMTDDGEKCVNALFLASVAALESGWGKSKIAQNKNNLFGWKGKDGWREFSSKENCILFVADRLKRNYIDCGLDTIAEIGPKYCDDNWIEHIQGIFWGLCGV